MEKRMETILKFCESRPVTVDVGCDHGYIGLALLRNKITNHLIATDISEKSLQKAVDLFAEHNLQEFASTRVGDGLSVIKDDEKIDQVIIAGIGGLEIQHIIKDFKGSKKIKNWVLQPMNEIQSLREFLNRNGFTIKQDVVVKEDEKFYHILSVCAGKQDLTEIQKSFGANIESYNTVEYKLWLIQKCKKIEEILKNLPKNNEKIKYFSNCLKNANKIKEQIKGV